MMIQETATHEASLPPDEIAANAVFDGVYSASAHYAQRLGERMRGSEVDGAEVMIAEPPEVRFVRGYFEGADNRVAIFKEVVATPGTIKTDFARDIEQRAKEDYGDNPQAFAVRAERADRLANIFIARAVEMTDAGEADGL